MSRTGLPWARAFVSPRAPMAGDARLPPMTIAIPRLDRSTAADRGITLADFLVPVGIAERMNARVRHIVLILAGTLFIILTTQVHIAIEPVPITGQTFGVLVAGCALGFRRGRDLHRPVRADRRDRRAGLRRERAGTRRGSWARPAATSSASSSRAPSSGGWPNSAGIATSAARSAR